MSRKTGPSFALALISAFGPAALAISQCKYQITLVPDTVMKAAAQARDFVRFRYPLSTSDSLLVLSQEDTETTIGPFDTGFEVTRDRKPVQGVSLQELPEFQAGSSFSEGFTTLALTRACASGGPVYFVTMQWMGDAISPALISILVPAVQGYKVSTFPSFSGGVVDVSKADPLHIKIWSSLHEGACNACETAYQITEYNIRDGKPILTRQYRTRHLYTSGNFDERRRIRFIP